MPKSRTRTIRVSVDFADFLDTERRRIKSPLTDGEVCLGLIKEIKIFRFGVKKRARKRGDIFGF